MPPYSSPTPLEKSYRQELSRKIEQLQGTRAAIRRMKAEFEKLGQRNNLPLPPELMGMIFDFYVHLYRQLPEKLLLVCRSWHALALSQPTLWTELNPLEQFGLTVIPSWTGTFIQSRIDRSNPAPLKVDFKRFSRLVAAISINEVAALPTFRPRIQELVINHAPEMDYLVGDQPMLKSLIIRGKSPLKRLITSPEEFNLAEKKLTTLRLPSWRKLPIWPDALLQRLHTLEVALSIDSCAHHEYWTIIQKSTALRTLRITLRKGSPPVLAHPSVRSLSIVYSRSWDARQVRSLEELRLPRLEELVIETADLKPLLELKLVETLVLSLRLTLCRPHWDNIDPTTTILWVDNVVCFLRSTSRLREMEMTAPSCIVSGVLGALETDKGLCPGLKGFIANRPMTVGTRTEFEAKLDQLRGARCQPIATRCNSAADSWSFSIAAP